MNTITTTECDLAGRGAQSNLVGSYAPFSTAHGKRRSGRLLNCIASAVLLGLLSACSGGSQPFNPVGEAGANSGGGGENNPVDPDNNNPAAVGFTVGGTISGVLGEKVVLLNNGKDELVVADDGTFEFKDRVSASGKYDVSIKTQPTGFSKCSVEGTPSGTVSANVADIKVVCKAKGTVSEIGIKNLGQTVTDLYGMIIDSSGDYLYVLSNGDSKVGLSGINSIKVLDGSGDKIGDIYDRGARIDTHSYGVTIDKANNIYVAAIDADAIYKRENWKATYWGTTGASTVTSLINSASNGLSKPRDVILSTDEKTLYVLNSEGTSDKKILKVDLSNTPAGVSPVKIDVNIISTQPNGIAVDTDGNLYIANTKEHNIIKVSAAGKSEVFAGSTNNAPGSVDGKGTAASFKYPTKIVFDSRTDMLYVTDSGNHRIRKISKTGAVGTVAGNGVAGMLDGPIADATFDTPIGITVDPNMRGTLYVTDNKNKIRKIEAQ